MSLSRLLEKGRQDKEQEQKEVADGALTSFCQVSFQGIGEDFPSMLTCRKCRQPCSEGFYKTTVEGRSGFGFSQTCRASLAFVFN